MMTVETPLVSREQRQGFACFLNRYEKGAPWEGYTDHEVLCRLLEIRAYLTPASYRQVVRDVLERVSSDQRERFGIAVLRQAHRRGIAIPGFSRDEDVDQLRDAGYVARLFVWAGGDRDDEMCPLFPPSDPLGDTLVKGVMASIVATGIVHIIGDDRSVVAYPRLRVRSDY